MQELSSQYEALKTQLGENETYVQVVLIAVVLFHSFAYELTYLNLQFTQYACSLLPCFNTVCLATPHLANL